MMQLIRNAQAHDQRVAVRDPKGFYTYRELLTKSKQLAGHLLTHSLTSESRVGMYMPPSFDYVVAQWGIWRAGAVAVPLCIDHPLPALTYVLQDAGVTVLLVQEEHSPLATWCFDHDIEVVLVGTSSEVPWDGTLPEVTSSQRALILYTSGTTGQPKGVVSTHSNIQSQITSLVQAWQWQKTDHILNILPLHHVHGIINILCCALWVGGCCEFIDRFSPRAVWQVFRHGFVNVFMAVPTIYYKLIHYWEQENKVEQEKMSQSLAHFRLMVSGSAALPITVLEKWTQISGQILLERYGMTEIGMALSNPYDGDRRPGHVGLALPGVAVRLADEVTNVEITDGQGEIQVKGANVFKEYWQKPEATQAAFTADGWFKTGDIASINEEYFQILGRNSVDIIKSGGYKISALQVEEALRKFPDIIDCAVVGLADPEWGEIVAAAYTSHESDLSPEQIKMWLRENLPPYQVPRAYVHVDKLPRNTIGKVTKKEVRKLFV